MSTCESKRIKKLRSEIIKQIPKVPNNKATKEALQAKPLTDLLIDYANWAFRYVAPRPREVQIEPTASNDPRWRSLSSEISVFLDKVRKGEDLTPHLSLQVHKGYVLPKKATGPGVERWADKDFLLTVMGYHHFHLGLTVEPAGHVIRTENVLFAAVSRDKFIVVGIFDHSAFESTSTVTQVMTTERERLWDIFDKRSKRGVPPGSVFIPSMIMLSGHSYHVVRLAQDCARIVREIDSKLENLPFVQSLYENTNFTAPPKPKLLWSFKFLDFGLLDETLGVFFVFRYGPN